MKVRIKGAGFLKRALEESKKDMAKRVTQAVKEAVDHPSHYGGADNPYEAIKVIEAWGLGFCLGNVIKYISRAEHKGATVQDLEKAAWYLKREIERKKSLITDTLR